MKSCSKCKDSKPFDRFPVTDFGKPGSQCKDCISKKALENYYKDKNNNTALVPEKNYETDKIKCKDFFFYQNIL